jgi:hypothetical protein
MIPKYIHLQNYYEWKDYKDIDKDGWGHLGLRIFFTKMYDGKAPL